MKNKNKEYEKNLKIQLFEESVKDLSFFTRMLIKYRRERWENFKKLRPYIIKELGENEYEILKTMYKYSLPYDETAKKHNITRERVRFIKNLFFERLEIYL